MHRSPKRTANKASRAETPNEGAGTVASIPKRGTNETAANRQMALDISPAEAESTILVKAEEERPRGGGTVLQRNVSEGRTIRLMKL